MFAVFGAAAWFFSPWAGIPFLVIAILYFAWVKELVIDLGAERARVRNGIWPIIRKLDGPLSALTRVGMRSVSYGTHHDSFGTETLVAWEVELSGFDGELSIPVWQEGDEGACLSIAEALAALLHCDLDVTRQGTPADGKA